MKKLLAVSALALVLAACSEVTSAPTAPSFKSPTPSAAFGVATTGEEYTFEIGASDASPFTPQTIGTIPSNTYTTGGKGYLGGFKNDTVTMVTSYTPGTYLNLSLYMEGSWDGLAKGRWGGATWSLVAYCGTSTSAAGTFVTTFANKSNDKQSYPDALGAGVNPGATGAQDINLLGFSPTSVKKTNNSMSVYDAVYPMSWSFPTCAGGTTQVTWAFVVTGIGSGDDEFWGLDNLSVSTTAAHTASGQQHSF